MFLFFAGPTLLTSDGELSYPKNVPIFITERRFGGVGAPEGLENVPDILTQNFPQSKGFCLFIIALQYQNFPQIPKLSAKHQNFPQNILNQGS